MLNNPDPTLINDDLAPTSPESRNWSVLHMASLWIGMVVCVPTYMLAGGLIALGMNWWQAVGTVLLGNVIVLVPMILNGHAGTKLGVPFPVLSRASFGIRGANVPSILRGLVACGWFGIQTAIGGSAIYQLVDALTSEPLGAEDIAWLHLNPSELVCFLVFLGLQLVIIYRGIDSIKLLETWAAPFLILMGLALLGWAYQKADGFGNMLSAKSAFDVGGEKEGQFLANFFPALTGMVGFWATLSLNIPDFTRYAKTQKDQALGQAIGLPLFMTLFAFIGVAVTSASVTIYGEAIPDPTELAGRMGGGFGVALALAALTIATLSTNIAANVVSPANAIMNLSPQRASFRIGGFITAIIGVGIMPWRLIESTGGYIFTWLIGYSALLGPIGGIIIADYFLVRRTNINVDALFRRDGEYWYKSGFNWTAIAALTLGILPNVPGFLHQAGFVDNVPQIFQSIYIYAWFVGFLISGTFYTLAMPRQD
ncbi:MAG: NCS1 family nucleobase:cation symporter-1 [Planctomycetota bacterium]|nr:NCS1 family nucleobase:cation symporter-1 [Planctomycetota bacterium]MDG2142808.1 NCS1 family nucleobase:cation symporter-1 [Planctomycetota bacterium]